MSLGHMTDIKKETFCNKGVIWKIRSEVLPVNAVNGNICTYSAVEQLFSTGNNL